jgi:GDP-L-fucose synthase
MRKILLTGSTGFVGKNLNGLYNNKYQYLNTKYTIHGIGSLYCDLRDQKSCAELLKTLKPDIVIHCAGSVGGIGANRENPGKFMYDNLIMGTNVIHESMVNEVSKFIMIGTVCSYPKHTSVPFKEEDLWLGYPEETNAPYGIAKKTLMKLVETYHEQYGLKGVNLIPVNMYGPHDHFNLTSSHVIPALILKVKNAIDLNEKTITLWGSGNATREFLYAEDLGEAIDLAIEKELSPSPINIGTGKEISIKNLAEKIATIMGFNGQILYDSTKPDGQPRRCLDTSKAQNTLGFNAKTSLDDGLKLTIDWFLKETNNNGKKKSINYWD